MGKYSCCNCDYIWLDLSPDEQPGHFYEVAIVAYHFQDCVSIQLQLTKVSLFWRMP